MEFYNLLTLQVLRHYSEMATIIQKSWRGYFSRKFKFNYQGLHCWIAQIKNENCHVEHKLHQFQVISEERYLSCKKQYLDNMCSRLHFLQRTRNIPGVFSNIHCKELSQLEECLNNCRHFRKYQQNNITTVARYCTFYYIVCNRNSSQVKFNI